MVAILESRKAFITKALLYHFQRSVIDLIDLFIVIYGKDYSSK